MDQYIQNHVRIENLKEGEARKIVAFLNAVHQDLLETLESVKTEWSRERYLAMVKTYEQALNQVFENQILPVLKKDGLEFTAKNLNYHYRMLSAEIAKSTDKTVSGATVATNLSPEAIHSAALAEPMQSRLLEDWARELKKKDFKLVDTQLRQAWIEGESIDKAINRLKPGFKRAKRDLQAITRTYYSHLTSETRQAVFDANSDLIDFMRWDSILDNRTTYDICGPRDQLEYTLNGEPIDHDMAFLGGPGRAHWNCRSMSIPAIKGVAPTVRRPAISAGDNYERGDNKTRTGRVRKNTKDSRERGIYDEKKAKYGTTYEKWLKTQPKAFQEDVLGVKKAKAFRDGTWKLAEKFVPENPTTLEAF